VPERLKGTHANLLFALQKRREEKRKEKFPTATTINCLFAQLLSDVVKSSRRAAADQIPSTTTIRLSIPITVRKVDKVI